LLSIVLRQNHSASDSCHGTAFCQGFWNMSSYLWDTTLAEMKKRGKFFEIGAPTAVGLLKASPAPRTSISNPVSDFAGLAPLRRVCIKTDSKDQARNSLNLRQFTQCAEKPSSILPAFLWPAHCRLSLPRASSRRPRFGSCLRQIGQPLC